MGRLADRQCYPVSVALGMVPLVHLRESPSTHRSRRWLAARRGVDAVHGGAREVVLRMGAVAERDSPWGATCAVPHVLTRSARTDES